MAAPDKSAATLARWREEYTPRKVVVEGVVFDGDLSARLEAAQKALEDENKKGKLLGSEIQRLVAELQEEAVSKRHTLVFQKVSRWQWQQLKANSPPTEWQRDADFEFDFEAMMKPAAMACCCEIDGEPMALSQKLADFLYGSDEDPDAIGALSNADAVRIWTACLKVNEVANELPKAVTAAQQNGARKSKRRSTSESPSQSS